MGWEEAKVSESVTVPDSLKQVVETCVVCVCVFVCVCACVSISCECREAERREREQERRREQMQLCEEGRKTMREIGLEN